MIRNTCAQLPINNYFKVDKDYILIDSTIVEFDRFEKNKIEYFERKAKQYLKTLDTVKERVKIMETYHYIINANLGLNRQDSTLVYLYKTLNLPEVKSSKGAINIYWAIFRIYSYSENYLAQLEIIKQLKKLGSKYNYARDTEPKNLEKAYADVLSTGGYHKEASEYYTKFLVKDYNIDPLRKSVVLNDLAVIYEALNKPDSVVKYRNLALKNLSSNVKTSFDNNYTDYIRNYILLHKIWYSKQYTLDNLKFAEDFLKNATKNYAGEAHTAVFANQYIAAYYFFKKDYQLALHHIDNAFTLGFKKSSIKKLQDLYFFKSRVLDKLGKEQLVSSTIEEFNALKAKKLAKNRRLDLIRFDVNQIKEEKEKAEKLAITNEMKRKNVISILIFVILILVISFIYSSITGRKNLKIKAVQEEVKQKLKEKEFLLKELNHRVKNNLALILSLVEFQSNEIDQIKYKDKFKSLKNRIKTIASAHDQLIFNENNLQAGIHNLEKYILKIANPLINVSTKKVILNLNIKDFKLNIDTLLPIGIMTNELISNSLKHAVTQKELILDITITLDKQYIKFDYKDSGEIFKPSQNKNSLGLEIIESMVLQLKGNLRRIDSEYFITLKLKNTN